MIPELNKIYQGDCVATMKTWPDAFVQTVVTSPPYWGLRDYGVSGQIGLERTPEEFIKRLVGVFREVRRVLRDDGTLWLNLGDSYASGKAGRTDHGSSNGSSNLQGNSAGAVPPGRVIPRRAPPGLKEKDLAGIPWMAAFALRNDGWYLRSEIIWAKPNVMPESVTDRPTKAHEQIFLLSKSKDYYYDHEAIKEDVSPSSTSRYAYDFSGRGEGELVTPGGELGHAYAPKGKRSATAKRNKRTIWIVSPRPFMGAHFATFPEDLIVPCILAGSRKMNVVFDPFMGAGTTGLVAAKHSRRFIGCEINPEYIAIADKRIKNEVSQEKMF